MMYISTAFSFRDKYVNSYRMSACKSLNVFSIGSWIMLEIRYFVLKKGVHHIIVDFHSYTFVQPRICIVF